MTQPSDSFFASYDEDGNIVSVGRVFGAASPSYTNTVRSITEVEYNQFIEANKPEPQFPDEQLP